MQQRVFGKWRFWVELAVSAVVVAAAIWIFYHRQLVLDQIALWQYKPSPEVASISVANKLTPTGQRYFYVSQPSILSKDSFNKYCPPNTEKTIILGCYANDRIYVYKVNDQRLPYVEEVTAAHEMLHAAYWRLSDQERSRVNEMVNRAVKNLSNSRLLELAKIYQKSEPGQLQNEMHSILGTEVRELPGDLEAYYTHYFSDRGALVAMSEQYEGVFALLKKSQQDLMRQINELVLKIDNLNSAYEEAVKQLEADITNFNAKASGGGFVTQAEYDQQRALLLQRQASLTQQRGQINLLIDQLKTAQSRFNAIAIEANSLNKSLNSNAPAEVPGF